MFPWITKSLKFSPVALVLMIGVGSHPSAARAKNDDGQQAAKAPTDIQTTVDPASVRGDIQKLVQQLGDPSYAQRRDAYNKLLQLGVSASEEIEQAAQSSDRQIAESARRLKVLLKVLGRCQDKQVALEVADLFLSADEENLSKLTSRGLWDLADLFLTEHDALVTRSQETFYQELGTWYLVQRIIDDAEQQGDLRLAWPIVSRLVPVEIALWTARKLDLPQPVVPNDDHHQAQLLFSAGEFDKALGLNVSPALKYRIATRAFRWQLLADAQLQQVLVGVSDNSGTRASRAMMLEFAGNHEASIQQWREALGLSSEEFAADGSPTSRYSKTVTAAALKQLKEEAPIVVRKELDKRQPLSPKPAAFYQLVVSLIISGQFDAVKQYIIEEDPQAAFGFLAQDDFALALKTIGLEPTLSNFDDQWLPKQVREVKLSLKSLERNQDIEQELPVYGLNLAQVGSRLAGVGHSEEAKKILNELVRLARDFRGNADVWNRCILRTINNDLWRELCIEVISQQFEQIRVEHRGPILEKLFPNLGNNALAFAMEAPAAQEKVPNRWAKVFEQLDYLDRVDKEYFGSNANSVVRAWIHRAARFKSKIASKGLDEERSYEEETRLLALAKLANDWDDTTTAIELLGINGPNVIDEFDHFLLASRICLKSKQAKTALDLIEAIPADSRELHWRSLVRMEALLACGQIDAAEQELLSRWMRLNGVNSNTDRSVGYRVVEDFMKDERWEDALEYAERNFAIERPGNYYGFWQSRQYALVLEELEKYETSANVLRSMMVELLRPNSQIVLVVASTNDLEVFRSIAARERSSRAAAAISAGDIDTARRELDMAYRLQPLDVETVVVCYPLLIKAGQQELANEILRQHESALLQQISMWPMDAMHLNNLAWMYAKADVNLEDALKLSLRATELVPKSAVYRDTLAEIQFHMGNVEQAIDTMRGCVKIDPREKGYRKNLVRFSDARK